MVRKNVKLPATNDEAIRALQSEEPLGPGDPRYVDLSKGRGVSSRVRIRKQLEFKALDQQLYFCFASHRGSGKTTELNQLRVDLASRYFTVYLQANVEMNPLSIELDDLLLVMARQVEAAVREGGVALDPKLLDDVADWFASVVESTSVGKTYKAEIEGEVKAGVAVPRFASWMSRVSALYRVETNHRTEVKNELRKYPGELLDRMNGLLRAAHEALKQHRNQELLVIIDNLDRYDPNLIDPLLIKSADQITSLACNIIFTPPIALVYQPQSGRAEDMYAVEVMPSVKLRERDDPYDAVHGAGADLLLELLGRRVKLDTLIPSMSDRLKLVRASGGSSRELVRLTRDAFLNTDGPLTEEVVDQTVTKQRGEMRSTINLNGWADVLAGIMRTKQPVRDVACLQVLFHRYAFQYNGTIWYDVHPLVAEIPEVQDAGKQRG